MVEMEAMWRVAMEKCRRGWGLGAGKDPGEKG